MEGDVRHGGTLDDYAYTIQGFITLYESTFDSGWLDLAVRLQEAQNELFADEAGGYHYTPRDAEHLIARVKDFFDGAMPNSNAVSALNLLRLHRLTRDDAHLGRALGVFGASAALMRAHPSAFSQMFIALDFHLAPPFEVVIARGPASDEAVRAAAAIRRNFAPSLVIASGDGWPAAGRGRLPVPLPRYGLPRADRGHRGRTRGARRRKRVRTGGLNRLPYSGTLNI
jgi:uncharacterized protein YyaL (SSP411 family)